MAHIQHYSKQTITAEDIKSVVDALCGEYLTTGSLVEKFENDLGEYAGVENVVVTNSCTSALYLALKALYIGPGDHVIVPAISFMATANVVEHCGAKVIFADVDSNLLIDPKDVENKITPHVRAIIAVDYAGQVCDYAALKKFNVPVIADAAHSFGAMQNGIKVGAIADITCTSFHPVKTITTCEGGALFTNDAKIANTVRRLRNHGVFKINLDNRGHITARSVQNSAHKNPTYEYDVINLGWNFRLSDVQCALGISQLKRIDSIVAKRNSLAMYYHNVINEAMNIDCAIKIPYAPGTYGSDHIFVVLLPEDVSRQKVYLAMKKAGIGVQVHYKPIYRFTYYINKYCGAAVVGSKSKRLSYKSFGCPNTEKVADRLLSLPLHCDMNYQDIETVLSKLNEVITELQRTYAISA